MTSTEKRWKKRESGIELLRLISMFMIITNHVIMSLVYSSKATTDTSFIIPINNATKDWRMITIVFLRHGGNIGVMIFFVCSAWFLIETEKTNKRKWMQLLMDNWVISMLIFLVILAVNKGEIIYNAKYSIFPFLYCNNWFISCYLIFLVIAPFLNIIIRALDKKTMFRFVLIMTAIALLMGYVLQGSFFLSQPVDWFVLYFIVAYMKKFGDGFASRTSANLKLFLAGFLGLLGTILLSDALALAAGASQMPILNWNVDSNPFVICMAIGLFNLFRNLRFKNPVINYMASLMLFVYLIHENIIIRKFYRALIWKKIYEEWGYEFLLTKLLLVVLAVYVASLILSILYDKTIRKVVKKAGDWLYQKGREIYLKFEDRTV